MPAWPGKLIALEGPDGGGKGTQIEHLWRAVQQVSLPAFRTFEAGATETGKTLRHLLLDKGLATRDGEMDWLTSAMLFMADRRHNLLRHIIPALSCGKLVVCDRYALSTIAYQGYGLEGGNPEVMIDLTRKVLSPDGAHEPVLPDLWLVLDVPAEVGMQRKGKQVNHTLDRLEEKGTSLQERVRDGYMQLLQHSFTQGRTCRIDATQTEAQVHHAILAELNRRFGLGLQPVI